MKVYKLIKKYPNSPELGVIVSEEYKDIFMFCNPKDYPEFWKEVKQKEYEVLTIIYNKGIKEDEIAYLHSTNTFVFKKYIQSEGAIGSTLEACISNGWEIKSVKRLSDGEVFTLGDKISHKERKWNNVSISELRIVDDYILARNDNGGSHNIECIEKHKQPLFRTEDGVEIDCNTECFGLNIEIKIGDKEIEEENIYKYTYKTKYTLKKISKQDPNYWKIFSTKEVAEKYIEENKPKYSEKDIESLLESCRFERGAINIMIKNWKERRK